MARVEILMPLYQRADTVAEAWDSLAAQSMSDFRCIAVDDGSTDDTAGALAAAASGDPRLELVRASHGGIAAALNRGLARVTAPVVARMDGDDRSHPRRLERLLALLEDPSLGVVGSRLSAFPAERVTPNMARYLAWQNALLDPATLRRERFVESTLAHGTAAIRSDLLVAAGGWSEARGPEDLDLWLRLHRAGVRFRKSPEVLYEWRLRADSETRAERCSNDAFHRCRRHHLVAWLQGRGIGSLQLLGVGTSLRRWEEDLGAAGLAVEAIAWRPTEAVPAIGQRFVVACFGVPRARSRARRALGDRLVEDEDFVFVGV